jgi:hypothetical protein
MVYSVDIRLRYLFEKKERKIISSVQLILPIGPKIESIKIIFDFRCQRTFNC